MIENWVTSLIGRRVLPILGLLVLSPSVVRAECPAVLTETQALGSPAHTAQILVNNTSVDCPAIKKVSAVLFSGEEIVSSKAFYDDAILNPPLQFPIVDALELPNVAGLYRIEWTAEFLRGEPQALTQRFTVPCGAPFGCRPGADRPQGPAGRGPD